MLYYLHPFIYHDQVLQKSKWVCTTECKNCYCTMHINAFMYVNETSSSVSFERNMVYFVLIRHSFLVADISALFPLKGKVHKFHSFFSMKTYHPSCAHCLGDLLLFLLPKWLHKLENVNWEKKLDIILDTKRTFQLGIRDKYH